MTHAVKSQLERLVDGRRGGGEERHQWIARHAGPAPLELRTKLRDEWLARAPIRLVLHNLSGAQRFVLGARDIEVVVGNKTVYEGEVSAGPMVSGRGSPVSHAKPGAGGAGRVSPGAAGGATAPLAEGVLELVVVNASGQPPSSKPASQAGSAATTTTTAPSPSPSPVSLVAHADPPSASGASGTKPIKAIPIRSFGKATVRPGLFTCRSILLDCQ